MAATGRNGSQASLHVVLQEMGGVGRSFIPAILDQYSRTKPAKVHCVMKARNRAPSFFLPRCSAPPRPVRISLSGIERSWRERGSSASVTGKRNG